MTPQEFKQRRESLGLKPEELAAILDTTPRAVRNWEQTDASRSDARKPDKTACRVLLWMTKERDVFT